MCGNAENDPSMHDQCYCNGAVSGGLPLAHPRGLRGCRYSAISDATLERFHVPGTDYYDGRDGSIEAEDDDEDRIEEVWREEWAEFLEWQRDMGA